MWKLNSDHFLLYRSESFDWKWVFVYNHPVFWSINNRINFILNIRLDYLSEHGSQFGEQFRNAVRWIPSNVTDGWLSRVEKFSPYGEILRHKGFSNAIEKKYLNANVGMALLTFSRNCLIHAGQVKKY